MEEAVARARLQELEWHDKRRYNLNPNPNPNPNPDSNPNPNPNPNHNPNHKPNRNHKQPQAKIGQGKARLD